MAKKKKQDRGPTSGGRFKRVKRDPSNGPSMARRNGEHLLTEELQAKLVNMIRAGAYAEVAARACGISKQTFYDWLLRGGRGEEPFKNLADAVATSGAESEVRDVALVGKHAEHDWRAAAWRLERKHPKRYGRKDGLEITGNEDKPIVVQTLQWGKEEISFDGGD